MAPGARHETSADQTFRAEPLEARVAEVAARQGGVVSLAQLRGLGMGDGAVKWRVAVGRLHRVHRGVYAVGHPVVGRRGLVWAVVLSTNGVASHRTAAWLHGLARWPGYVEVTATARKRRGVRVHRSALENEDRTRVDGLPTTTFARTLLDCADVLTPFQLQNLVNEGDVQRRDFGPTLSLLDRARGRHGATRLRQALAAYADGETREGVEQAFAALVAQAGLDPPKRNASVEGFTVDAHWPGLRLVVELDSQRFHATARKMVTDRARDRRLRLAGYTVLRFMHSDVARRPAAVLDDLSRAGARARRAGASSASRRSARAGARGPSG
jgi:very-short-patch-repair endonuclease